MKLGAATSPHTPQAQQARVHDAATQLEAVLLKQVLVSSGVFRGTEAAGSALTQGMFADTLADALAKAGGLGLAPMLERAVQPDPEQVRPAPTPLQPARASERSATAAFGAVTSGFGARRDPFTGQLSQHTGVDLPAARGTPIPAAMAGVVVSAGPRGGYGNAVEVLHVDGTTTLYAHADQVLVAPGDRVQAGDTLATVGQTGRSTGPHLHLEVREGGHPINPARALKSYRLRAETEGGDEP